MAMKNCLFKWAAALVFGAAAASCAQKSAMDAFIDDLMADMTIEEKIGQLNLRGYWGFRNSDQINMEDENTVMLQQGLIGGTYGIGNVPLMRNLQDLALKGPHSIPLIFGMDVIHGYQTTFPIPLALSTSWNMDLIERSAREAAREATASGINWVFSPMVDIARDPRWGRIAEGAGEDAYLGGEVAKAMVYGYQGRDGDLSRNDNVMSCVKHYGLYGGAEAGRDYAPVFVSRQEALNAYLRPYQAAAEAGTGSYMSSFNEFEGVPATANHYLLTELLRDDWGFNGFVVSDDKSLRELTIHGLGDLQEVSAMALQAGLDMDMNGTGFVSTLKKSLDEGRVSKTDIEKACRRILEAKYKLGLFEDPYKYLDLDRYNTEIFTDERKAISRELAGECAVLLKNEGEVLPLKKNARIAVVGPFANNAEDMQGTWTMSSHAQDCVTILQGIRDAVDNPSQVSYCEGSWLMYDAALEQQMRGGMGFLRSNATPTPVHTVPQQRLIAEAVAKARAADVVVACVGETNNMNGEGSSRVNIVIPDAQVELLKALKSTGKPVVLVLTTGRPLILEWEDENMDAILNTWSLGIESGHVIADLLFGDVNPSAKLTTTFPRHLGQLPIYYNHKNTGRPHPDYAPYKKFTSCYIDVINAPVYPFGYGLSYTTFSYSDVTLSSDRMSPQGKVTASVTVTNTGKRDGKEIVQLYIHDVYSTSTRPVKELKGFEKIDLKAGESKTVTFEIDADDLKYYNHDCEYVLEPGDFEIMVGPNSRDIGTPVILTVG